MPWRATKLPVDSPAIQLRRHLAYWYGAETCMTSTTKWNDFEDARLQSHFEDARLQNSQPLPSRLPLSNPRKAKIQTIGFHTLAENVPDDPNKAAWKGLTLPTKCITRESILFIHIGRKFLNPRPHVFFTLRWKYPIPRMRCFLPGHNTLIHSSNAPPTLGHEPALL